MVADLPRLKRKDSPGTVRLGRCSTTKPWAGITFMTHLAAPLPSRGSPARSAGVGSDVERLEPVDRSISVTVVAGVETLGEQGWEPVGALPDQVDLVDVNGFRAR